MAKHAYRARSRLPMGPIGHALRMLSRWSVGAALGYSAAYSAHATPPPPAAATPDPAEPWVPVACLAPSKPFRSRAKFNVFWASVQHAPIDYIGLYHPYDRYGLPLREPFAVALDNAVEGCVRETFGALVAAHQAARAEDLEVAAVMDVIAFDEARHASWRVADFLEPQLSAAERGLLARAKRAAVQQLSDEAERATLPPIAASAIGWPEPELARALAARMAHTLGIVS